MKAPQAAVSAKVAAARPRRFNTNRSMDLTLNFVASGICHLTSHQDSDEYGFTPHIEHMSRVIRALLAREVE